MLTNTQLHLLEFVKDKHFDQVRKYTGEPYYFHLVSVADILSEYKLGTPYIEAALCHDLFEDTECTQDELQDTLFSLGYSSGDIAKIINLVGDLTDVYTKGNFPTMNRVKRKISEAKRLAGTLPESQTIKYADFIDNARSITEYDVGFARVFLKEKFDLLSVMNRGDFRLYMRALSMLFGCMTVINMDHRELTTFEEEAE